LYLVILCAVEYKNKVALSPYGERILGIVFEIIIGIVYTYIILNNVLTDHKTVTGYIPD